MRMVRKQFRLATHQIDKLQRLARITGKSEAGFVRVAIDRLPEVTTDDPVLARLQLAGRVRRLPAPDPERVARAEAAYRSALGDRQLGLTESFLAERRSGR